MMHWSTQLWLYAAAALAVSYLGTWGVARLGRRVGWVAAPREDRWHTSPVALHGGVGFILPFLVAAGLWLVVSNPQAFSAPPVANLLPKDLLLAMAMLGGCLILFLCGLYDDFWQIKPLTKLIFQVTAASLFVYAGGVFRLTGLQGVDLFITYLWLVGITNAVNLLDNMDGLSSGVALLAGVAMAILAVSGGAALAGPLAIFLVCCLLGFWLHNKPPARIFMGDSGSLAMGFALAAFALPSPLNGLDLLAADRSFSGRLLHLILPVALLAVPIFDTTFVTLTRLLRSSKVHQGGRDHTSHRLVRLGFSEWRANLTLYGLAAAGGLIAILARRFPDQVFPFFGALVLMLTLMGAYLSIASPAGAGPQPAPQAKGNLTRDLLFRKNLPQLLLDTVLIASCFWAAYLLRFDFKLAPFLREAMFQALPLVVASCLLGLRIAGAYRGSWRMASFADLPTYGLGALLGATISLSLTTIFSRFGEGYSRSAYVIFGFLFFLAITLSRLSFRMFDTSIRCRASGHGNALPVLIYGAGRAGKILYEEIVFNKDLHQYRTIGFIDDDRRLWGNKVCGMRVDSLETWKAELAAAPEIWVSSPAIPIEKARAVAAQWSPSAVVKRLALRLEDLA